MHLFLLTVIQDCLHTLKSGNGFFQVFAGFNAIKEDLGISSTNMRLHKNDDAVLSMLGKYFCLQWLILTIWMLRMEGHFDSDKDEAPGNIPMMYVSFPSAKDPICFPYVYLHFSPILKKKKSEP